MKLSEYLKSTADLHALAEKMGVNVCTIYRHLAGNCRPSPSTMQRIVTATGGAVTPNDFYEIAEPETGDSAEGEALRDE